MLHEQFEHQNAASTLENERLELKHVANTVENRWNGSFQLQSAANSMENGQNWKPAKKTLNGETNPKTIPDPCKNMGQDTRSWFVQ